MPTLKIPVKSELHQKLIAKINWRMKLARQAQSMQWERWKNAENKMIAYLPESAVDAKRRMRRDNSGEPQYTTIQLPYTYALVMTAHTYWTSVFFGRSPIHQFAGTNGTGEMQVQAMEALIQYQVSAGRMLAPYYIWLYDAAKYGVGIVGEYWDQRTTQYGSIETDPATGETVQVSRSVPGYQGNCIYNISPYDFFPDPRVTVGNMQRGEFVGVECPMAWHEVLIGQARGDYMNVSEIQFTSAPQRGDGDRENASSQVLRPDENTWVQANDSGEQNHPARVRLLEFYVECSPKEWGVGNATSTEKWCFTVTGDLKTIIGARPLGAIHGEFPFAVIESELEAYGAWNRGLPEMVDPIQRTMDWLVNTHFYNVRATLNNQFIFDPSRLNTRDFEKGGPGFAIRMRPEAYGQDVRTMFAQMPVTDVTRSHMGDLDAMWNASEKMTGINEQMFGSMQAGGRKTATEIRTSTGFGTNRQKTQTEWISASSFFPHAWRLVKNTQQYYNGMRKLRIVGDAATAAGAPFITVTPETIAGEFDFVPVDGTLPIDRFAQVTMWKDLLSTLLAVPGLAQSYDLVKLFGWVFSLGGLKNVDQFKIQTLMPGQGPSQGMIGSDQLGAASGSAPGGAAVVPFTPNVRRPQAAFGGGGSPALPTVTPQAGADYLAGSGAL